MMIEMTKQFGKCWDLLGSPKYSETKAVVGAINEDKEFTLGLTAMQMINIGSKYGPCSIENGGNLDRVKVYNAFGASSLSGNKVWISQGMANEVGLEVGDTIILKRAMDKQGQIYYFCKNQKNNTFGQKWGRIETPAEAIVAAIDTDGYNSELYRIGLSAMQLDNLSIERKSPAIGAEELIKIIAASQRGLLDGKDYGSLRVTKGDKIVEAQVYNSFGERSIEGCGVRVSSILAEDLELKLEDRLFLG